VFRNGNVVGSQSHLNNLHLCHFIIDCRVMAIGGAFFDGHLTQYLGFISRQVCVGFIVNRVALGQDFHQ